MSRTLATGPRLNVFAKETMARGHPAKIEGVEIGGQIYRIAKSLVTVVSLEDDWYEDVVDPEFLKRSVGFRPDIFTFWQRLPDVEPKYSFYTEWGESGSS